MTGARRTTFGAADRHLPDDVDALAQAGWEHVAGDVRALAGRVMRDVALAHASGRWRPGQPDPDRYLPGDAVALRAFTVTSDFEWLGRYRDALRDPRTGPRIRREAATRTTVILSDVQGLYDAVPHFLDGDVAAGVLASRPPDPSIVEQLRLPHPRVALFLGRVFDVPAALMDWPADWDEMLDLAGRPSGVRTVLGELKTRGGGIEGVVLTERPGGGLADEISWLLSADPDPRQPPPSHQDRLRSVVAGRLSHSHLTHVAWNLAATLAWGEWHEVRPVDLPADPQTRQWRKAVRRGEFRRREPHGGAAGIHVLDLARSRPIEPPTCRPEPSLHPRSSPSAHLRRAHWRIQPVGPHRADRRLTRVAATIVNPSADGPMRPVVYRIPEPDEPLPEPDQDPNPAGSPPSPLDGHVDLRTVELPASQSEPGPRRDVGPEIEP